ncbi:MAG: hypothetical protein E6Q68_07860 [Polynucleobacter sp.]|nr:MAG: hypothetical protein E6Q68_07860 [Polynucleobacter sp.]
MKKTILLLSFVLAFISSYSTNYNWYGGNTCETAVELYNLNVNLSLSPGDTVFISKKYKLINLQNIRGTRENPIVFVLRDSALVGCNTTNGYGITLDGYWYEFLMDTSNTTGWDMKFKVMNQSGVLMNNGIALNSSYNCKINGISIEYAKVGILSNPLPGTRRPNITIENIAIQDIQTGLGEGLGTSEAAYLGNTGSNDTTGTSWFDSLYLINIRIRNVDGDGIQITRGRNIVIMDCIVTNWGRKNINQQRTAYLMGGASQGSLENIVADSGTGTYLMFFGDGYSTVNNFRFTNGATSAGESGIYLNRKNVIVGPTLSAKISNGVMTGSAAEGVRNDNAVSVVRCNTDITGYGTSLTTGSNHSTSFDCGVASSNKMSSVNNPMQFSTSKFGQSEIIAPPTITPTTSGFITTATDTVDVAVSTSNTTSVSWQMLSGSGRLLNKNGFTNKIYGTNYSEPSTVRAIASGYGGIAYTNFTVQATPSYDSIEAFGAVPFYTEDKFYGTMTITPYATGDSSLITYTGADSPFTSDYLDKEFVAFRAHRTDSFPTTKNWIPGVSSCVYSKVIRIVDGKNVRVNFKYNGNNESSPQVTTGAYGYFFYDNRAAFNSALSSARTKPISLKNGSTYAVKGLFGDDYLSTENPIIFVARDTNSSVPANIKYSIEDEWTANGKQLWGGWNEGTSVPTSYSNEFGSRIVPFIIKQNVVGGEYTIRFSNIRMLPPHYSNRWQQGSSLGSYFVASGSVNGSNTYQHWGVVDIAGSDSRFERRRYSNINFPDTPSFILPFGFAYSNGGGKSGTVSYPTGDKVDIVEFMDYRLRPNPANTANSTWLSNANFANIKNKVKTALSTIAVGDGTGGYGIAGNKFTLKGIGRDTSVDYTIDTLLADIGLDISPNTRVNSMRTRAMLKEVTVNGEQRLVMDGSPDSSWTVWSIQTYYDWSAGMVGSATYAKIRARIIVDGDTLTIPLASAGSEQARPPVGLNDSKNFVVQNVRSTLMAHTLPSVGTNSKLYIQTALDPKNFSIWPHLAVKGDTITVTSTGDKYRVSSSKFVYTISSVINYAQGLDLVPLDGAPALSTATNQVLDITFNTAKARNYLDNWYAGVIIDYPRQTGTDAWNSPDLIVDGGEMNYGDSEVNHDFANMRKWGNLRYGTEFGEHVSHNQQLWKMPKIQKMKNVFEYRSADWYGNVSGKSFWRREAVSGVRTYYEIDGGWMKGVNGGGASRVRYLNKPKIGGGNTLVYSSPLAPSNAIPMFSHGFVHDGNGAELLCDIRVTIPEGDTMDLRNSTFRYINNGLTVHPYGPNSRILMDNFTFIGGAAGFSYEQAITLSNRTTADTAMNMGTPISTGSWVGNITGNNVVAGFSGTADYNNLYINLTSFSPTPLLNRWWITTAPTYPLYCSKVLINGLNPTPNSSPISYINPCPPL